MRDSAPRQGIDFNQAPFLVIWETTRSCALACQHCRAEAVLGRDARELDTAEGKGLLDQVAEMGTPIVIFSGGDPLNRPDLEELIRHGRKQGLRLGTIPAATDNITRERIRGLKEAGLDQIAFSVDGPTARLHDSFRGIAGAFDRTMEAIAMVHEEGLSLQINTCFAAWNFPYLEDMVALTKAAKVAFWEVFFLIPMGRGQALGGLSAEQFELVFDRLYRLNYEDSFIVKLTEAQHYRRFVIQKELAAPRCEGSAAERIRRIVARPRGINGSLGMSPQAVNAGKGIVFIDHMGNICPSGFLPIPAGNLRRQKLSEVYRGSPLFLELRDPGRLMGKCGTCEFASMCGGSRARAYAMTSDYMASDPGCAYAGGG
ncbi:MAG: TIGR04053 family radical SAM/SPASM domain-containing protein [Elusimicrobia bacterium]|nr:TIGR04053 family radical SAM/SPASM domain-containing protein [Elusimicrobiota bacterium]